MVNLDWKLWGTEDIEIVSGWGLWSMHHRTVASRLLSTDDCTTCTVEDRADKARFSRLRQACPEPFELFKIQAQRDFRG